MIAAQCVEAVDVERHVTPCFEAVLVEILYNGVQYLAFSIPICMPQNKRHSEISVSHTNILQFASERCAALTACASLPLKLLHWSNFAASGTRLRIPLFENAIRKSPSVRWTFLMSIDLAFKTISRWVGFREIV